MHLTLHSITSANLSHVCTLLCRERQKGLVATLEAELEGKLGQLQLLSAENEMLKLRASVLESTVASREYAVSALEIATQGSAWICHAGYAACAVAWMSAGVNSGRQGVCGEWI
jgi:hypothetical protein